MNREEIQAVLPHRDPMLLLDEVTLDEDTARGSYQVRGDEFFLQGHFPGHPIVPGVILCEMLAQSACVLLKDKTDGQIPLYTGLDHVRFRSPVFPGHTVQTTCRIVRSKGPFYFAKGEIRVEDRLCVSADFSFALKEG